MKKLFGFLFVLAFAFVLFACGKEYKIEVPEGQANVTVEKGESVTITPTFTEGETLVWATSDDKVVTVDGGKLTAVEVGNATITIKISGKEDKAQAEVKVTVVPVSVKEIALANGKAQIVIGEEFTLTATVSPENAANKELEWSTSNAEVATVAAGKVKGISVGEATITATAKDGSGKKAEFKVTVNKISVNGITINGKAEMNVGENQTLQVTVAPENATNAAVQFTSSDTSVLTVDATGKVTAVANGTAKVTVTSKDDDTKKAEIDITVKTLVADITIDAFEEMNIGETQKIDVAVDPEEASNKEYDLSSSDETILTVAADGTVTALAAGTAKVIATAKDGSGIKDEFEITVKMVALLDISIVGKDAMILDAEQTLTVSYNPENASYKDVEFKTSDAETVSIDAEGKVKALKLGKATITATTTSDKDTVRTATLVIEVFELTTALNVKGSANQFVGDEQTLVITTTPATAMQKFDFLSSDPTVASVLSNGVVKALKPGTTTISATAKDGSDIKVELAITVGYEHVYVKLGATEDLTINEVTYKLNEQLFATVNAAVAAVGVGGKVHLLPGEYTEEINLDKSVTLTSDLASKNPVEDDADFKDATKAAVIKGLILTSKANTTIEGLTFTGDARVGRFSGQVANFTFQNNLVYDTKEATVAWQGGRYGNGVTTKDALLGLPGFLTLSPSWAWVYNTQILNNKFDNVSDTPVFITCVDGLTAKGNLFKDIDRDAIRLDYASDAGHILVEDNVFENVANMGVYVQSLGGQPLDVEIYSNYFKNIGTAKTTTNWNTSAAIANAVHQEAADAVFTIKYNIFEGCNANISLRTNVAATFTKKLEATIEYNAFILADGNAMINRNLFGANGSDTTTSNKAMGSYNKNFYGTDLLTKLEVGDANYENVVAKDATVYNNIYALEKALPSDAYLPAYTATPALKTVAEAYDAALDTPVTLKGQVSYVYGGGFWLKDQTGAIYVYGHSDEVKLGDKVEVEGNVNKYKDTKRLNFAKTVKVTEAGTYTAEYAAKTEDEFKALTEAGLEITLADVLITKVSNTYVTMKVGATEFTLNTNDLVDAAAFAGYISTEKKVTVNVLTYFKDGDKVMSVMGLPAGLTPEEGFAPSAWVINAEAEKKNNVVNKFSELTLADGMVIKFADGDYEEPINIDKNNVTLESVMGNSVLTAVFTIADGVEGLTVKGLTFTEKASVIAAAPAEGTATGLKNITFDGVKSILASSGDDAWMHFYVPVENFKFLSSYAEFKTNRGIRFEVASKDVLIENNTFINTASHFDTIRAMDLLDGEVTITNNWFENTTQSFVQIRFIGNGNYNITCNTFKNASCVSLDMREAKTADFEGKAVINVLRNTFDGGENDWGTIRLRNSWKDGAIENAAEKVEANINYNKFININFDSDTTYYVDKPTKNCTAASWNIDYNYSDKGLPVLGADGWFCGMEKSAENWFTNVDEYEYAAFPPVYNFETYFDSYASSWGTSYSEKVLTNDEIGSKACIDMTFTLTRGARQTVTVTNLPILAANASSAANATVYFVAAGDLSGMKSFKIDTQKWSDTAQGRYFDIHLEYTKDGKNWIVCSKSYTTAGVLESSQIENAIAVRLVFTTKYSGNVQLAIKSIEFTKDAPATETPKANLTIDFMDGTVGKEYKNNMWTQEKYPSTAWQAVTGQMNCREKNGVRVVNVVSGSSTPHRFTYNKNGGSLGIANKLTLKAGNYFDGADVIPIKVIVTDIYGMTHYLVGSADAFYDFPVTTGLVDQELTFDACEVVSFAVIAKSAKASAYLYLADIHLTYVAPTEQPAA